MAPILLILVIFLNLFLFSTDESNNVITDVSNNLRIIENMLVELHADYLTVNTDITNTTIKFEDINKIEFEENNNLILNNTNSFHIQTYVITNKMTFIITRISSDISNMIKYEYSIFDHTDLADTEMEYISYYIKYASLILNRINTLRISITNKYICGHILLIQHMNKINTELKRILFKEEMEVINKKYILEIRRMMGLKDMAERIREGIEIIKEKIKHYEGIDTEELISIEEIIREDVS